MLAKYRGNLDRIKKEFLTEFTKLTEFVGN